MAVLAPDLVATLDRLTEAMAPWPGQWCVITGAAMALHGFGDGGARDIDVIATEDAARGLMERLGLANLADGGRGEGAARFRSRVLLHPPLGVVPVEVFAGFEVFAEGRWQAVPMPRGTAARLGEAALPVATRAELARLFSLFGRPKDLRRAALLNGAH